MQARQKSGTSCQYTCQNYHYINVLTYMLLGQDFYTGFMQNCRSKKQPESHFKVKQIPAKTWMLSCLNNVNVKFFQ